ncbi:conserved hypothetical protein [Histoplasma capsulatum H143]|uniref:Uncharacterized protein n=1 Tax=Ajellomyces capsulatus (strain H143) TaxID=544712 RepID=C6HKM8_AJECH|nr:conserved hypothetical protein [Histoplasma capsulatum H143]
MFRGSPQEWEKLLPTGIDILGTTQPRTTLATAAVESSAVEVTPDQELLNRVYKNNINPIDYWIQQGHWPKKYFRQGNMNSLLARKKSSSFHHKQSESGSVSIPSDQKPRDEKRAPYRSPRDQTLLESKGSFMKTARVGITDGSSTLVKSCLTQSQLSLRIHYFKMNYSTRPVRRFNMRTNLE